MKIDEKYQNPLTPVEWHYIKGKGKVYFEYLGVNEVIVVAH